MVAPYVIFEREDGQFDLVANRVAGAPDPTADERDLAGKITNWLNWVRLNPEEIDDPNAFVLGLRQTAELGLTRDAGRDVAAARQRVAHQFGDSSREGDNAAAGLFRVTLKHGEINVELLPNAAQPSEEQLKFLSELSQQERMLRALYERGTKDDGEKKPRLEKVMCGLLKASKLGLEGQHPNTSLARVAIQGLIADAIQLTGARVRGRYLNDLAVAYVCVYSAFVIFTVLSYWLPRYFLAGPSFLVPGETLGLMDVAVASLAMGAWLIAAFRLQPDSPEVLTSLFSTTTSSSIRVILVLGFGFLGLLLFYKQVIVFSFGPGGSGGDANGFTTSLVFSKLSTAILAGGFLGLGDAALPSAVIARSSNLVAALVPR